MCCKVVQMCVMYCLKYLVCRGVGPEHVLAVDVVAVGRLQGKQVIVEQLVTAN